jgi:hypothetical protein
MFIASERDSFFDCLLYFFTLDFFFGTRRYYFQIRFLHVFASTLECIWELKWRPFIPDLLKILAKTDFDIFPVHTKEVRSL